LLPGSLQGGVPLAPTAEPSPLVTTSPQPTATLYQFSLPATETPRPRRVLGADSGPTPTPLLLARAPGVSGRAPAANAGNALASDASGNEPLLQSAAAARSFSPELLPEYAAYIVTVAALLVMAWYVLHRRNARAPTAATEPGEDGAGATRTAERE
jgi:hypothetical protein